MSPHLLHSLNCGQLVTDRHVHVQGDALIRSAHGSHKLLTLIDAPPLVFPHPAPHENETQNLQQTLAAPSLPGHAAMAAADEAQGAAEGSQEVTVSVAGCQFTEPP